MARATRLKNSGPKKWQVDRNRPHESVTITDQVKKEGFKNVGQMTLTKDPTHKANKSGYFNEENNPKK